MSRKFVIELEDKAYDELLKIFEDAKKAKSDLEFEGFLSDIVTQFVNVKNQTSNLFSKSVKEMLENFDPSQLSNLFSSMKDIGNMFGEEPKKDETQTNENPSAEPKKRS